jgi:type I restriction enzyme M protein
MLDSETKRRIDSCRDILVGKVPDPKSQVEQITIALIYKFMDDMDAEAEELGGKRSFFAGKYAKYGWAKLMSPSMGGFDVLALYSEAIAKMNENPGIPALFRDIFKNAYLPYRDPETLRSFLKEINVFTYDHSERLGDAFEYLLSVLGSQGDAGQFRTPRHIIDFMVEIINPQKNESILDPACGTAGFLISAWKHILKSNTSPRPQAGQAAASQLAGVDVRFSSEGLGVRAGDLLTPEQRKHLAANIHGYDISPDMVRLSLVNLYLHGFTYPHIVEYDTLTSEDKWNETADVILANPPFMSPKGGIKPHKRFSIQAKRSEVLFVDYMAEHLSSNGRAAIIVPEGIIFQSQTAYAQLRKMLVVSSLVAVISLPAGCFNPYSGVKTSILIFDKSLAKKAKTIAFFKVENDGFGLGAQRRAIDKNDLPQVQAELAAYLQALRSGQPVEELQLSSGLIVAKEKIAANEDYNLSGERYGVQTRLLQSKWPTVPLGEICTFMTGGTPTSTVAEYYENGSVPWLVSGDIHGFEIWDCKKRITQKAVDNSNARILPKNSVLIALNGQGKTRGTVALLRMEGATCNQSLVAITPTQPPRVAAEFMFWIFRSMYADIRTLTGDNERSGLNMPILRGIKIPLPPLDVQKEIVAEIEGYQKVINGARAVLDHYRPHISIHPDWPTPTFLEAPFEIIDGDRGTNYPKKEDFTPSDYCLFLNTKNVRSDGFNFSETEFVSKAKDEVLRKGKLQRGDVVLTTRGTIGNTGLYDDSVELDHIRINSGMLIFRPDQHKLTSAYLFHFFQSLNFSSQRDAIVSGSAQPQLPIRNLNEAKIPLPPLATQQQIVAEIEAEQALVAANRELIARFEKKIQATLARVWGEAA